MSTRPSTSTLHVPSSTSCSKSLCEFTGGRFSLDGFFPDEGGWLLARPSLFRDLWHGMTSLLMISTLRTVAVWLSVSLVLLLQKKNGEQRQKGQLDGLCWPRLYWASHCIGDHCRPASPSKADVRACTNMDKTLDASRNKYTIRSMKEVLQHLQTS